MWLGLTMILQPLSCNFAAKPDSDFVAAAAACSSSRRWDRERRKADGGEKGYFGKSANELVILKVGHMIWVFGKLRCCWVVLIG